MGWVDINNGMFAETQIAPRVGSSKPVSAAITLPNAIVRESGKAFNDSMRNNIGRMRSR